MRKIYGLLFICSLVVLNNHSFAQADSLPKMGYTQPVKVAIFIPLYLSDAFNGTTYKLGKTSIPKNILPGLEFYNGVMMALDSLSLESEMVDVEIFDTKQDPQALTAILNSPEMGSLGLIIASITNTSELKLFSDKALQKNIPLISATYPNFVGISENPFFVLLNSAFTTHIDGMFRYMQRYHPLDTIVGIKKPGSTEDYIQRIIADRNRNSAGSPVNIKWVNVRDDISTTDLLPYLDSLRNNIIFVASPLEDFGLSIVRKLSEVPQYRSTVLGMPTWDGIAKMNKSDCKNVEIVYSTPFQYNKLNPLVDYMAKSYKSKYHSRPSDMVYKGFEVTYHFIHLLAKHRYNLVNNLSDNDFTVFNQFEINPVKRTVSAAKPDYLENKKLYFVLKQEGNIKSVYQ